MCIVHSGGAFEVSATRIQILLVLKRLAPRLNKQNNYDRQTDWQIDRQTQA